LTAKVFYRVDSKKKRAKKLVRFCSDKIAFSKTFLNGNKKTVFDAFSLSKSEVRKKWIGSNPIKVIFT
jgi:hypothetical protein